MDRTTQKHLIHNNLRLARKFWPNELDIVHIQSLKSLTSRYRFSIAAGQIQILNGRWYVTHAGLLDYARRRHCTGIQVHEVLSLCDPLNHHWVFRATVHKNNAGQGFEGYGDADPSNVSPLVRGAEMRIAETRAVNRALRKAYGIGLCSVEELGWSSKPTEFAPPNRVQPITNNGNGHHPSPPRLRDQLCLLIRQYELDPNLVKAYAAHFCGTETIKEASRDLVESFISHIAASAKEDRDGLICKLNSFSRPVELQQ